MRSVTVASRFCGPPTSANGGYFAGLVAGLSDETVTVRLMRPPPLDTPLEARPQAGGAIEVYHGSELIGASRPASLDLDVPAPASYFEAVEASRHCPGFAQHWAPTCFVCGPQRVHGDGLRIFPGPLRECALVAAPWTPDVSLDGGDGKVRPEFMWAALDCPGFFAAACPAVRPMLLGELTAHVDRLVHVDEPCVVIGWRIGTSGRKHDVGTALFDESGTLCARARALWIEPRPS